MSYAACIKAKQTALLFAILLSSNANAGNSVASSSEVIWWEQKS